MGQVIKFGISNVPERISLGSTDVTINGMGNIISAWNNSAPSDLNAIQNTLRIILGQSDNSLSQAYTTSKLANGSTSDSTAQQHLADIGSFGARLSSNNTSFISKYNVSAFITDGITLNYTDFASARVNNISLMSSDTARCRHFVIQENPVVDGKTEIVIPFEPDFFRINGNGDDYAGANAHEGFATSILCYGTNDKAGNVKIVGVTSTSTLRTGIVENYSIVYDDDEIKSIDPTISTLVVDGRFKISFDTTDGIKLVLHTLKPTSDAEPADFSITLYDLDGHEVSIGIMDTPTSTGVSSLNGGFSFKPQAIEFGLTHLELKNTFINGANAGSFAVGSATASIGVAQFQSCASVASEQGVSTSNTQSSTSSSMIDIYPDDGSNTDRISATFSGFINGGVSANFSRVATNAKKMTYVAFSEVQETGLTSVQKDFSINFDLLANTSVQKDFNLNFNLLHRDTKDFDVNLDLLHRDTKDFQSRFDLLHRDTKDFQSRFDLLSGVRVSKDFNMILDLHQRESKVFNVVSDILGKIVKDFQSRFDLLSGVSVSKDFNVNVDLLSRTSKDFILLVSIDSDVVKTPAHYVVNVGDTVTFKNTGVTILII